MECNPLTSYGSSVRGAVVLIDIKRYSYSTQLVAMLDNILLQYCSV